MRTAVITLTLMAFAMSAFGQKTYIWKGGKPGRSNDWHCPSNWSTYRVPDEFADVIIPENFNGNNDYPVINQSGCEINTLRISRNAHVTIADNGSLTILNPDYCDDLSRIVAVGKLIIPGRTGPEWEPALALRQSRNH